MQEGWTTLEAEPGARSMEWTSRESMDDQSEDSVWDEAYRPSRLPEQGYYRQLLHGAWPDVP